MPTVRVRIAVAVTPKGEWASGGYCVEDPQSDATASDLAIECLDRDGAVVHYIEADVPVPDEGSTVEGRVTD